MRRHVALVGSLLVVLLSSTGGVPIEADGLEERPSAAPPSSPASAVAPTPADITGASAAIPFIANDGQTDARVAYYAHTFDGTVFVTRDGEIVYALPGAEGTGGIALNEALVGATVSGVDPGAMAAVPVSTFRGSDPARWRSRLRTFDSVELPDVYPGIDLRLAARANNVEKVFLVAPGADPSAIRLAVSGAQGLSVDADGLLVAATERGEVRFSAPIAFQEVSGVRQPVEVTYTIAGTEYGFALGGYDASEPLVIDPTLASTLLGGTGFEAASGRAPFDAAGPTTSIDCPATPGAFATGSIGSIDLFVAKFDHDLTTLLAATYIGGSGLEAEDLSASLAIDWAGNVFVGGRTASVDIPIVGGPYQAAPNGGDEAFVAKLSGDLSTLLASTYLGGSRNDARDFHMRTASDDAIVVAMRTNSPDYPTTPGAFDETYNDLPGDSDDVVISRLTNDLTALAFSTYIGGSLWDGVGSMKLDAADNVYIGGITSSPDYPTTAGAYQGDSADPHPFYDGYVSKLLADLSTVLASTYFGTDSWYDAVWGVEPAPDGTVYVVGSTISPLLPMTPGTFDTGYNGDEDSFVARFSADLTTLMASTYLGGTFGDRMTGIALDAGGHPHMTGSTHSPDFPVTAGALCDLTSASDGVFLFMDADLLVLGYSTFVGGTSDDVVFDLVFDASGGVYLNGFTTAADFPTSPLAWDDTLDGPADAFIIRPGALDTDGDGVPDDEDAFPDDADESGDADGDGLGDNADPDDDNDGTPDGSDAFPLDPNEDTDTDGDGLGNNADGDDDNDTVPDGSDSAPLDRFACSDVDGDLADDCSSGTFDPNDDGTDTDGDGQADVGLANVGDEDDDNDGFNDDVDVCPLEPGAFSGCPIVAIGVDIEPFKRRPLINLGSNGTVKVATYGSPTFDVKEIDISTVTVAGAAARPRGRYFRRFLYWDINRDGHRDLLVYVRARDLMIDVGFGMVELEVAGATTLGIPFFGTDTVKVWSPRRWRRSWRRGHSLFDRDDDGTKGGWWSGNSWSWRRR